MGSVPPPPELTEAIGVLPPVPSRLLRHPRWVLAVAGGWRCPERIHVQEARAALLGLRRAAMDRAPSSSASGTTSAISWSGTAVVRGKGP